MGSPEMHLERAGKPAVPCEVCGQPFTPKRASWARFCSTRCRNAFHAAEARKEKMRAAAPELYEALLAARKAIAGKDAEHIWINYPTEPALELGALMDQALVKAGYKEPEKPKPVAPAEEPVKT